MNDVIYEAGIACEIIINIKFNKRASIELDFGPSIFLWDKDKTSEEAHFAEPLAFMSKALYRMKAGQYNNAGMGGMWNESLSEKTVFREGGVRNSIQWILKKCVFFYVEAKLTKSMEITTLVFSGLSELPPAPELHGECLTMVMYRSRAIAAIVPVETMMLAP